MSLRFLFPPSRLPCWRTKSEQCNVCKNSTDNANGSWETLRLRDHFATIAVSKLIALRLNETAERQRSRLIKSRIRCYASQRVPKQVDSE
jgi:hypothetical protein